MVLLKNIKYKIKNTKLKYTDVCKSKFIRLISELLKNNCFTLSYTAIISAWL